MKGTLYLIPTPLSTMPLEYSHPPEVLKKIHGVNHFAVEKLQQAVQFLSKTGHPVPEYKMGFHPLDKHVTAEQLHDILSVLTKGEHVGVITEAGCPGIADPGAQLVWLCHSRGIHVEALVGPSAITLSVMYAGLNGQQFAFNGYLPVDDAKRDEKIRTFEGRSANDEQTQVFIEAPFRNSAVLQALIENLQPETRLAVCWNLMAEDQFVVSKEIQYWATVRLPEEFDRKPAMFLFLAPARQQRNKPDRGRSSKGKSTGRSSSLDTSYRGNRRK
ncbi:MAG: SAM-dependent methyltransferase, partial [Balneolales bacterium]|nr:SAM-dependent methyltransferase [Balneolales bacterium]